MNSLTQSSRNSAYHARPRQGFIARLNATMALYRSRARLAQLDANLLADIGLTRKEAQIEANRPIWDAPSTWTC